jgi:hypothetical protein
VLLLPDDIAALIHKLTSTHPEIREVWLIGSRANPTERPPRDWDFLIFATPATLSALRSDDFLGSLDIDLLVATDHDHIEGVKAAQNGRIKTGHLNAYTTVQDGLEIEGYSWQWTPQGNEAEYTGRYWKRFRAFRVHPEGHCKAESGAAGS